MKSPNVCPNSSDKICYADEGYDYAFCVPKDHKCPITSLSIRQDTLHNESLLGTPFYFAREAFGPLSEVQLT